MNIPNVVQPHDVVTAGNNIVVVMDGYIKSFNWSGNQNGSARDNSLEPFGVVFADNRFFVTNKSTNSVYVFDQSFSKISEFGCRYLDQPRGIAFSPNRRMLLVLSKNSGTITSFDMGGNYISSIKSGGLQDPWHIKCSGNRAIVSDAGTKKIKIYDLNNLSNVLQSIPTNPNGQYMHCRGLDLGDDGSIYVALRAPGFRMQKECIAKYSATGNYVTNYLDIQTRRGFFSFFGELGQHVDSIIQDAAGWQPGQNARRLDFARGIRYHRRNGDPYLLIADAGNESIRFLAL